MMIRSSMAFIANERNKIRDRELIFIDNNKIGD